MKSKSVPSYSPEALEMFFYLTSTNPCLHASFSEERSSPGSCSDSHADKTFLGNNETRNHSPHKVGHGLADWSSRYFHTDQPFLYRRSQSLDIVESSSARSQPAQLPSRTLQFERFPLEATRRTDQQVICVNSRLLFKSAPESLQLRISLLLSVRKSPVIFKGGDLG